MYCPRCSQAQTSYDVRFCPGCGLLLDSIVELLSTNGVPVRRQSEMRRNATWLRRKGIRIGAKLMFFAIFLLPVAMVLSIAFDSPGPLAMPFITFLGGLALTLYTFLFGEDRAEVPDMQYFVPGASKGFDLPAPQNTPIPHDYSKRINTSEMAMPQSVTEHTTKLL